jgi:hypothetical protein
MTAEWRLEVTGSTAVEQSGAAGERVAARAAAAGASSGTVGQQAVRAGGQSAAALQHGGAQAGVQAAGRRRARADLGEERGKTENKKGSSVFKRLFSVAP